MVETTFQTLQRAIILSLINKLRPLAILKELFLVVLHNMQYLNEICEEILKLLVGKHFSDTEKGYNSVINKQILLINNPKPAIPVVKYM